jgi:hypothetical protein
LALAEPFARAGLAELFSDEAQRVRELGTNAIVMELDELQVKKLQQQPALIVEPDIQHRPC